ncbi:uncharacterized protein BO97DRAFT_461760 [Aspergillus homomorphus CBS 101889]|uniref:Uncharacterized protein n=1 Tax=Aspergillus homomorphus (strain CBS 101889) TaxID=1450537 RepID=A0A395HKB6_ASPHC|nr:hypothetical protein BO97DRAFT_461760 [Aspergillus homomorphus CBS 101889]RAL08257.1 hypothetical protein BO97DRAFT_461760 [Aspergillus homomorphus CBS 101889]
MSEQRLASMSAEEFWELGPIKGCIEIASKETCNGNDTCQLWRTILAVSLNDWAFLISPHTYPARDGEHGGVEDNDGDGDTTTSVSEGSDIPAKLPAAPIPLYPRGPRQGLAPSPEARQASRAPSGSSKRCAEDENESNEDVKIKRESYSEASDTSEEVPLAALWRPMPLSSFPNEPVPSIEVDDDLDGLPQSPTPDPRGRSEPPATAPGGAALRAVSEGSTVSTVILSQPMLTRGNIAQHHPVPATPIGLAQPAVNPPNVPASPRYSPNTPSTSSNGINSEEANKENIRWQDDYSPMKSPEGPQSVSTPSAAVLPSVPSNTPVDPREDSANEEVSQFTLTINDHINISEQTVELTTMELVCRDLSVHRPLLLLYCLDRMSDEDAEKTLIKSLLVEDHMRHQITELIDRCCARVPDRRMEQDKLRFRLLKELTVVVANGPSVRIYDFDRSDDGIFLLGQCAWVAQDGRRLTINDDPEDVYRIVNRLARLGH